MASKLKNIASVAAQLISITRQIKPLEEKADELKEALRVDFPGQVYSDPEDGSTVTISNKTEDRADGTVTVFNEAAYHNLPLKLKQELLKQGVVDVRSKIIKGSIPRVTVKLK